MGATAGLLCMCLAAGGEAAAQGFEQLGDPTRHTPTYDSGAPTDPDMLPQCAPGQADPDHTGCRPIEWILHDQEMDAESSAPEPDAAQVAPPDSGLSLGSDTPSDSDSDSSTDSGSSSDSSKRSPF